MLATKSEKSGTSVKKLQRIQRSTERHWVGDGFPVRTLFGYSNLGSAISPFLLLDYAGPTGVPADNETPWCGWTSASRVRDGNNCL